MKVKFKTGSGTAVHKGTAVSWQRYAWIGAALGLYFGLFFQPLREASLALVIELSLVAALVTVVMRAVRAKRSGAEFNGALRQFAIYWAQYAFFLAMLEGRHLAYAWGGKAAAALFATLMGAVSGLWYGYTQQQKIEE